MEIKLADFGFATFFDKFKGLKGCMGSPIYMAPEIVSEKNYDQKCDIWSAGVLIYYLLTQ